MVIIEFQRTETLQEIDSKPDMDLFKPMNCWLHL